MSSASYAFDWTQLKHFIVEENEYTFPKCKIYSKGVNDSLNKAIYDSALSEDTKFQIYLDAQINMARGEACRNKHLLNMMTQQVLELQHKVSQLEKKP